MITPKKYINKNTNFFYKGKDISLHAENPRSSFSHEKPHFLTQRKTVHTGEAKLSATACTR